ncbi:hypothetical protein PCANC_18554 [Puccinia coronata f. sp. avenae]|uniref:RING-type E3 ubiquitin transferase n=1 Tax=Puccinia coronata f. sp. avenae TaxID=200324 RepID=A0A2N5ST96_9BASI|nr:hypothetical protein PCANC_18554 [Puccinia coronata f. sp. avenae]PLW50374.1 hypothetical protein PCASD_01653 [Puccinia coronata f. sp. avenae]
MESSYPGDLERVVDLPRSSPGDVRTVEASVGPESSSSSNQTGSEVPGVQIPNGAEEPVAPVVLVVSEEENRTMVLEANSIPSWDQVMQTLSPENQILFENTYDGLHRLIYEITNDHYRTHFSSEEISDYTGDVNELMRITASIPPEIAIILSEYFEHATEELARLHPIVLQRQYVVASLDYLTRNNPRPLCPNTFPIGPSDHACVICFESYAEEDVIVVLPCHRSHHFHRACVEKWLLRLIPEPLTCPNCRTQLAL